MKPIKSVLVLAAVLAPAIAFAQPPGSGGSGGYYSTPPRQVEGGFHDRTGRVMWGINIGLGGMHDRGGDIECDNCAYSTLSGQAAGHIGGMLNPRLGLMAELQGNLQQLEYGVSSDEDVFLTQSALMFAAQYWVMPQLWIKGGIGFAHLQISDAVFVEDVDNGMALMGAIGFEVFSARRMSVDLQGRLLSGMYKGIDNTITAGSVGIGINWF
ncbi:MAG: hypothetical protein AB7O24_22210 [Kofleriaceae bacterium]